MNASIGKRVVLVHGATSGPWVFDGWAEFWPGDDVRVPDLQEGLDVAHATMSDYADRVVAVARDSDAGDQGDADRPLILCGWSMGGLVAMMAALRCKPAALVLIEPSVSKEIDGGDAGWPLDHGSYESESTYGHSVDGMQHRPESLLARGERKRGISIPGFDCPVLVIAGPDFGDTRGAPVAKYYGAKLLEFPTLSHFQLVVHPWVREAVAEWVGSVVPDEASG